MNFQTNLQKLILSNSPQVDSLRTRVINGNKETFQAFQNVFLTLLNNKDHHPVTYRQVNELLISGQPDIARSLNQKVLPKIASVHDRNDLDEYVIFWKRIMNGSALKKQFPNLTQTFQNVKIHQENRELSQNFVNFTKVFQKNVSYLSGQRVQFFNDADGSFLSDSVNQDVSSDIIEMDMQQIEQIKHNINSGQFSDLEAEEYLKKAKNFLCLQPKSMRKQLSLSFNNNRLWAKQFVQNYQKGQKRIPKQKPKTPIVSQQKINSSRMQINIHDAQEEQILQEHNFKRQSSKRYQLANVANTLKVPKPQNNLQNSNNMDISNNFSVDSQKIVTRKDIPNSVLPRNNDISKLSNMNSNSKKQPNFIHSTEQLLNKFTPQIQQSKFVLNNNSSGRKSIFPIKSPNKIQQPQQDLVVIKHGKKNTQPASHSITNAYDYLNPNDMIKTPQNQKKLFGVHYGMNTPNSDTAFQAKTLYGGSTSKKLSKFNEQKMQRKMGLANEQLAFIDPIFIKPYSQNFNSLYSFACFRRNCLADSFILYSSTILLVTCTIKKLSDLKVRIQVVYTNQSQSELLLQTLYRIPKCLSIEKYSQIRKKWILSDQYHHNFGIQLLSFPLEPCLVNLKYISNTYNVNLKQNSPTVISIPITIKNFVQYLAISKDEFSRKWGQWSQSGHTRISKHIILDLQVLGSEDLNLALKQLTILQPIQGYSVYEMGGFCRQSNFQNLTFLLRISQRVQNVMTIQLLTDREIRDPNQIDYLEYYISVWCMLMSKIDDDLL